MKDEFEGGEAMPVSMRDYPKIEGKDAERFLERHKENMRKLKEKVLKKSEDIKAKEK
jgi:hypothetical protein